MYNKKEMLNNILEDWEYRVSNGMPDVQNIQHRQILRDILKEHGLTTNEIIMIMGNLTGEKQILSEIELRSFTTPAPPMGRDKTHVTGSGHPEFIDPYQLQGMPKQDSEEDQEELEDDNQNPNPTIETYIFDFDQMKIVETGNRIDESLVLKEQKFKCFLTGEIYCETTNGTLVKETDIVKNKQSGNVYDVQKHNPNTQDLVKKNASPEDIKKVQSGNDKEKPTEDEDETTEKDKRLSNVDTLNSKAFTKEIDPPQEDFIRENAKYFNQEPPPHINLSKSLKGKIKIPNQYLDLLDRFMNTTLVKGTTTNKLSHFIEGPGGAGTVNSQAGELVSLLFTSLDDDTFKEVYNKIKNHVDETSKKSNQILTKKWVQAAAGNRKVVREQIRNKFPKGTTISAGAWDTQEDVEALGLNDYNKNKGFSTDVYYKLHLPDGSSQLYEVSLKQSTTANLLNSSAVKLLDWDSELRSESNPKVYATKERKMIIGTANKLADKIRKLDKMLQNGKIANMSNDTKEFLLAQKSKNLTFDKALEKANSSPGRPNMKVIYFGLKALADNGDTDAKKVLDDYDKMYIDFQKNAIDSMATNKKLKSGLIRDIKQEFPLKSIVNKEESMALGDQSLDSVIAKEIFGTDDFNKIKEQLITKVDDKGEPYLAYRAKVDSGSQDKVIPIAGITIRSNGKGYAGSDMKFEMSLHKDFKKMIKVANDKIYG